MEALRTPAGLPAMEAETGHGITDSCVDATWALPAPRKSPWPGVAGGTQ